MVNIKDVKSLMMIEGQRKNIHLQSMINKDQFHLFEVLKGPHHLDLKNIGMYLQGQIDMIEHHLVQILISVFHLDLQQEIIILPNTINNEKIYKNQASTVMIHQDRTENIRDHRGLHLRDQFLLGLDLIDRILQDVDPKDLCLPGHSIQSIAINLALIDLKIISLRLQGQKGVRNHLLHQLLFLMCPRVNRRM